MKIPRDSHNSGGRKPCINKSITVTKEAITTIYIGILTFSGTIFLINEITMLDSIKANNVATPMPKAFLALVVVARVGHIPKT